MAMNEVLRPNGDTVLHVCAEYGRLDIFKFYIKKGNSYLVKNYAEETPFHVVAREGKIEMM